MRSFSFVFPLVMILSAPVFTLFVRTSPNVDGDPAERTAAIRRLTLRLWAWTGAAILLVVAGHLFLAEADRQPLWILCFLFQPLWFRCAQPLLALKHPAWGSSERTELRRSASLVPHTRPNPVPAWAWMVAWAGCAAAIAGGLWLSHGRVPPPYWGAPLGAALWLASGPWAVRQGIYEPEPQDIHPSEALTAAYAELRLFKAWGFYAAVVLAAALFTGVFLLGALRAPLTVTIWVGAGGGSLLGVLGGAFGTWCSVRRVRIADMLRGFETASS